MFWNGLAKHTCSLTHMWECNLGDGYMGSHSPILFQIFVGLKIIVTSWSTEFCSVYNSLILEICTSVGHNSQKDFKNSFPVLCHSAK